MQRTNLALCLLSFFCFLLVTAQGCGGGVAGTGGQRFEGSISTEEKEPLPGQHIRLAETGQTTVANPSGGFVFESPRFLSRATFVIFDTGNADQAITLENVPSEAALVRLTLVYNDPNSKFNLTSVSYFGSDGEALGAQ